MAEQGQGFPVPAPGAVSHLNLLDEVQVEEGIPRIRCTQSAQHSETFLSFPGDREGIKKGAWNQEPTSVREEVEVPMDASFLKKF